MEPKIQTWVLHVGGRNSQGRAFMLLEWSYLKGKLWLWEWGDIWLGYLEGLKRIDLRRLLQREIGGWLKCLISWDQHHPALLPNFRLELFKIRT